MKKEELLEKIGDAKELVQRAEQKWLDDSDERIELLEVDRQVMISFERRMAALKSNYRRWYVNKTPHRRPKSSADV
jgi:hypothetical protein